MLPGMAPYARYRTLAQAKAEAERHDAVMARTIVSPEKGGWL